MQNPRTWFPMMGIACCLLVSLFVASAAVAEPVAKRWGPLQLSLVGPVMTADKFACAIIPGIALRNYGLPITISTKIVGELLNGCVATAGFLAHGHQDDVVEVTRKFFA